MSVCDSDGRARETHVTLVLPCLDEAAGARRGILSRLPEHVRAIVADNGSTDGSVEVARDLGAHVVHATPAGYGAACHAGIAAATSDVVACDGLRRDPGPSPSPPPLIAAVAAGSADMAVCRRRPSAHAWPGMPALGPRFSRGGSAVRPR